MSAGIDRAQAQIEEALAMREEHHLGIWRALRSQCESPIEEAFLAAVYSTCIMQPNPHGLGHLWFYYAPYDPANISPKIEGTHVYPQARIGDYRADFLFIVADEQGACRHIVVECDGHDFHERTKSQAAKDKSRDRHMTARGIQVFRFTGSEIHASPIKCWNEVWDAIWGLGESA